MKARYRTLIDKAKEDAGNKLDAMGVHCEED